MDGLSIIDSYKGYKPPGCTNSSLQWRRIKSPSAKSRRVFKLRIYLSTDKVFESLNSRTWLDFHYNIMIEVFKVALAQWLLFYQWI